MFLCFFFCLFSLFWYWDLVLFIRLLASLKQNVHLQHPLALHLQALLHLRYLPQHQPLQLWLPQITSQYPWYHFIIFSIQCRIHSQHSQKFNKTTNNSTKFKGIPISRDRCALSALCVHCWDMNLIKVKVKQALGSRLWRDRVPSSEGYSERRILLTMLHPMCTCAVGIYTVNFSLGTTCSHWKKSNSCERTFHIDIDLSISFII